MVYASIFTSTVCIHLYGVYGLIKNVNIDKYNSKMMQSYDSTKSIAVLDMKIDSVWYI